MGENVQGLDVLGRRYAAWVRMIMFPLVMAVGLLAAPDQPMRNTVLWVTAALGLWSVAYVRRVVTQPATWLTVVDTGALSALAMCTVWLVPATWMATGRSWVVPFVSFTAVVYQYYAPRTTGALCAVWLTVSMLAGTAIALPAGASTAGLITAAWSCVLALLGRVLWTFVRQGATRADDQLTAVRGARLQQAAEARGRAAENAWNATLHDNAATTLMMVGQGRATDLGVLATAAQRDLDTLAGIDVGSTPHLELGSRLRPAFQAVAITVAYDVGGESYVPAAVAEAFVGAVTEALNNVVRHADVSEARVVVEDDGVTVRVEIIDEGTGFDLSAIPASSRGLDKSIHARMRQARGSASITTRPGRGTRITLEWCR